jgi:hypothetical protein
MGPAAIALRKAGEFNVATGFEVTLERSPSAAPTRRWALTFKIYNGINGSTVSGDTQAPSLMRMAAALDERVAAMFAAGELWEAGANAALLGWHRLARAASDVSRLAEVTGAAGDHRVALAIFGWDADEFEVIFKVLADQEGPPGRPLFPEKMSGGPTLESASDGARSMIDTIVRVWPEFESLREIHERAIAIARAAER